MNTEKAFPATVAAASEQFAHHRLHFLKHRDVSTYTLHEGDLDEDGMPAWGQCAQLVCLRYRFVLHGDFNQANGMSVVGHGADSYFHSHGNDYVWSKFIPMGRQSQRPLTKAEQTADALLAKAFFYAIRDRFRALAAECL